MPVIYNKKVEYAYTDPGVKAHTLSWAEYQALSEDDKMNGDLYFIPDKQPEGNPSRIWTKLGTDPLTTQADDVSGAVNELNSSLTNRFRTVTSGSIHDIRTSGIYYLTNAVTDKPTSTGGAYMVSSNGSVVSGIFIQNATGKAYIVNYNGTTWTETALN